MDTALSSMSGLAVMQANAPRLAAASGAGVDKAAEDFSGMFFSQMLQPMFESVGVDPVFGGGHGEEVMRSFLVQEYGKAVAKSGFGITAAVKNQMLLAQANAQNKKPIPKGGAYGSVQQ